MRMPCSTSRTASPSTPDTWRDGRAAVSHIELELVPLADGAEIDDLGFGEDYELLAAVEDPGRFTVVGRCEEGEGVDADAGRRALRARRLAALQLAQRS